MDSRRRKDGNALENGNVAKKRENGNAIDKSRNRQGIDKKATWKAEKREIDESGTRENAECKPDNRMERQT